MERKRCKTKPQFYIKDKGYTILRRLTKFSTKCNSYRNFIYANLQKYLLFCAYMTVDAWKTNISLHPHRWRDILIYAQNQITRMKKQCNNSLFLQFFCEWLIDWWFLVAVAVVCNNFSDMHSSSCIRSSLLSVVVHIRIQDYHAKLTPTDYTFLIYSIHCI